MLAARGRTRASRSCSHAGVATLRPLASLRVRASASRPRTVFDPLDSLLARASRALVGSAGFESRARRCRRWVFKEVGFRRVRFREGSSLGGFVSEVGLRRFVSGARFGRFVSEVVSGGWFQEFVSGGSFRRLVSEVGLGKFGRFVSEGWFQEVRFQEVGPSR